MSEKRFDIVFLGAGPGGYVAAIRATQLGFNVAVIEKDQVGGTCLQRGCIPSKSLLRSAELYRNAKESDDFGIEINDVKLNFTKVQARKQKVVEQLTQGIEFLFKKNKISLFKGFGYIKDSSRIEVTYQSGESEVVTANKIVIATGSRPKSLPGITIDEKYILSSDGALELEQLPESMIIIGGGVIGMEWASLLNDFGVDVTVVEFLPRILPLEDEDISKDITRAMKKRKIKLHTDTRVLLDSIKVIDNHVELEAEKGDKKIQLQADKVLVSVGRESVLDGIGLENLNIETDKGFIRVDEYYQTSEPNVYAIGDIIGNLQLAHVASHEGIIAVEHIANHNPKPLDYSTVSKCTFTHPDVASVGLTESEAIEAGYDVKVGKFQFRGIGKAVVHGEVDGFVKLVIDNNSKKLLGAHMIGPHVTDMISEAGLAKVLEATSLDIAHTVHPHPTLSEAIMEAALAVDDKAIHG